MENAEAVVNIITMPLEMDDSQTLLNQQTTMNMIKQSYKIIEDESANFDGEQSTPRDEDIPDDEIESTIFQTQH